MIDRYFAQTLRSGAKTLAIIHVTVSLSLLLVNYSENDQFWNFPKGGWKRILGDKLREKQDFRKQVRNFSGYQWRSHLRFLFHGFQTRIRWRRERAEVSSSFYSIAMFRFCFLVSSVLRLFEI